MPDINNGGEIFIALATMAVAKQLMCRWVRRRQEKTFVRVGTVSKMFHFPVKSCKEVEVKQATVRPLGLHYEGMTDRQWMVIKPDSRYLSRKLEPKMVFVSVHSVSDCIQLRAPGHEPLQLPKTEPFHKSKLRTCKVLGDPVQGLDCGDSAASWINKVLGHDGLRLVCHTDECMKKDLTHMKKAWGNPALPGDMTAFPNWCPFLVCTESALTHVNSLLEKPVTMLNFRPNIVVEGTTALDEDTWLEIRIGDHVRMRCLEPCARCPLTTVDPISAVKSEEPLKTLTKHRSNSRMQNKPVFGVQVAADSYGTVTVGDPVYVIRQLTNKAD